MKDIFNPKETFVTIFGTNIPFLYIFIFFMALLLFSLIIIVLSLILNKSKEKITKDNKEIEISLVDEEINSIVKKYKSKSVEEEQS